MADSHLLFFYRLELVGDDGAILFDYSKNIINEKTIELLFKLVTHPINRGEH